MPTLKSGRCVGITIDPYLDALSRGSDESQYFAVVALRLKASTPEAFGDQVVVVEFDRSTGVPPEADLLDACWSVDDVLQGRSGWSADEVDEFQAFLATPRARERLRAAHAEFNLAIRGSPVWRSPLLGSDPEGGAIDEAAIRRAIVAKSAMADDALAQVRSVRRGGGS
jgi:hypothetical protein